MKAALKEKILQFNRLRAEQTEKAQDLMALLGALPPGQVKNLMKDDKCREILQKYGMTGSD